MDQHIIRKMTDRKRPVIELTGEITTFTILARARNAMRTVGWTKAEIAEATTDMMSDDHDHLVDVVYSLCDAE